MSLLILVNRSDDVVFDILKEGFNEWSTDILDSRLEPNIIMEEVSFTSKDTKVHSEEVIFTIDLMLLNPYFQGTINLKGAPFCAGKISP